MTTGQTAAQYCQSGESAQQKERKGEERERDVYVCVCVGGGGGTLEMKVPRETDSAGWLFVVNSRPALLGLNHWRVSLSK